MASRTSATEIRARAQALVAQAQARARALLTEKRRRETLLTAALVALALITITAATWATIRARSPATTAASASSIFNAGGYDLGGSPAPNFTLTDQHGATVSLAQFHGRPVVLTFFDSVCPHADCSIMAQYLNVTARDLGAQSSRFAWIALTVNPWHDTPTSATAFLQSRQVTVPMHYLLGTPDQMAPIWKDYHMQAILQSDGIVIHTTGVYVIDAQGRERAYVEEGFDPRALSVYLGQVLKQAGSSANTSTGGTTTGQPNGTVIQSQTAKGYTVELTATPARYGTYTFTVTLEDQQGVPVQGAHVALTLTMTAMEMVPVTVNLPPIDPPIPGTYQAQGVISMVGQWKAAAAVTVPGASQPLQATFTFDAKY
ncbi:MAG TPA: SCO family protein [Ktedonobacterales bacterium]